MVNTKNKTAIVILGMHRSGTSAVTAGLQCFGVDLGQTTFRVNTENPKGFYEIDDIFRLNDKILKHIGYSWSNPFIGTLNYRLEQLHDFKRHAIHILETTFTGDVIGIKDPRFCLLLTFWQDILLELGYEIKYIHVLRNPLEVAGSLKVRGNKFKQFVCGDVAQSLLLWITYYLNALSAIESNLNILVSFESLIRSPQFELNRLAEFIGIQPDPLKIQNYSELFIEKELKHHSCSIKELKNDYPHLGFIADFYEKFINFDQCPQFNHEAIKELLDYQKTLITIQPYLNMASSAYQHTQTLNSQYIELKTELSKSECERTLLQEKISILQNANSNFQNQLKSSRTENKAIHAKLEATQTELINSQRMLVVKDEQCKENNHKIQTLSTDLSEKAQIIAGLQNQLHISKIQVDTLREILSRHGIKNRLIKVLHNHSRIFSLWHINRQKNLIVSSGLFDEKFYRFQFKNGTLREQDSVLHFLTEGIQFGAWPNPTFDPAFYLERYPDVAASSMNPFIHYITKGKHEGRETRSS